MPPGAATAALACLALTLRAPGRPAGTAQLALTGVAVAACLALVWAL